MSDAQRRSDFIRERIAEDVRKGTYDGRVQTRFPPEPSGFLHVGHAKPITLNFGVAREFGGTCALRFDDTNPATENQAAYALAIQEDIAWLGFAWDELRFASEYFPRLYESALELIRRGGAFVCDLSSEEIAARRGTLTSPGEESPYRGRPVDENLDLFQRMQAGEFAPGARVLRAKIDMGSSVLPMRDPIVYRISATPHHRTGRTWNVYPMYDFAHSLSDAFEGVTHSLCGIEFIDRRPLYEWILGAVGLPRPHPQQIEFGELNVTHTVLSKRLLRPLVEDGTVRGWDDPRLPTLRGLRRRGFPPGAIRTFAVEVGLTKRDVTIEMPRLEAAVRDELNRTAPRVMAVLDPLKVVITNYPEGDGEGSGEGDGELLEAVNNPEDAAAGSRKVPFARELWIEREDFAVDPPKKFFRLAPGREVRLRYAYFVTCTRFEVDDEGRVAEVHCTYDPETRGGDAPDGRKVKGTLHWVSARHAVPAEVRLYEPLFPLEDPLDLPEGESYLEHVDAESLRVASAFVEPSVRGAPAGTRLQFERLGYFCVDPDATDARPVLNRTVTLRDSWAKQATRS